MSMNLNQVVDVTVRSSEAPASQYKTYILKPNIVSDVNTLTQAMLDVAGANTKFVIKYDYTLGENVTIPSNCILEFDGGSILGASTITGQNTKLINLYRYTTISANVTKAGTFTEIKGYIEP